MGENRARHALPLHDDSPFSSPLVHGVHIELSPNCFSPLSPLAWERGPGGEGFEATTSNHGNLYCVR